MDLKKIVEDCLKPISKDKPAGIDCKQLEIYTPFKVEISKIINPSRESVDWDKLIKESISLLSKKTKDIEIACYLTIALFKQYRYEGFLAGVTVFTGIINTFSDLYFPVGKTEKKTSKLRKIVVNSFSKRNSEYLNSNANEAKVTSEDTEEIHQIWNQLQVLKPLIETISVPPPSINELLNIIGEACQKYPMPEDNESEYNDIEEEKTAIEDEDSSSTQKTSKDKQKSTTQKTKPASQVQQATKGKLTIDINKYDILLTSIANQLRIKNPKSPVPYRIKRLALWDTKEKTPEAKNGQTNLAFTREMSALESLISDNDVTPEKIERLEANVDIMLWWLDLQRGIVQSMEQLGNDYKSPAVAIRQEIKYLIKRFPELPELKFKNGKEFADSKTRMWLEEIASEDGGSEFDFPSYLIDQQLKDDIKAAEMLANEDKTQQALSVIQEGLSASTGTKDVFCRKMAAGRFCLNHQRIREAQIIFEHLFQQSKMFHLSKWDPLLFLELCQNFHKSIKLNPDTVCEELKSDIVGEILKLNMSFSIK